MCGIFGFAGEIAKETAIICTNLLAHRGPDGYGLWHGDGITLGHRRLSILDLSEAGSQPMSYAHGRYWITYNGEIYNFLELRNELEKKGHRFASDTDTEVILAAFCEWGEFCLEKFNGMWAFTIWDDHEKTLFMSRDRFGKKPLFYAALRDGFAFASEMKALFPLLDEVRPNSGLVRNVSRIFRYENSEECLIEGIRRFPAAHCGVYKNGRLRMRRWWCTLDNLVDVPKTYDVQVEEFRSLFFDACRLRMRSDVPIGTALSGGLDSSSTFSAMAHMANSSKGSRISGNWQHAFVASFPGTPLDEANYAKLAADHLGVKATFVQIDPLLEIDRLPEYLYLFEELYITNPIPFMMTYGAMRREGVKVTVDGHGADELFAGYSFDLVNALGDAGLSMPSAKMVLDTYHDSYPKDTSQFSLPPKCLQWLGWHGRHFASKILRNNPSGLDVAHPRWRLLSDLNKVLYTSTHETVLPTLLRNYDRYSMANGVEIRMPFLDHRIVSFAFSLPWNSKIRGGFSKAIIRDAMSPYMPDDVTYRKSKIGFNSPIVDWMQGPLKTFFLDIIGSESFRNCNLIDPIDVAERVKNVVNGYKVSFTKGEQAWTSIMPYLWEEAVIKRKISFV